MNHPRFESEFLESLSFAFRKRRKAMRHHGSGANLSKVYERVDGETMERLEIIVDYFETRLRLHAWPDRQIWVSVRFATKKGEAWKWSCDGRLIGSRAMQDVIAALEASIVLVPRVNAERTREFDVIWASLIARGPRAV